MKGRSIWNRPPLKRADAYKLLLDLGGEARWKDLKANLNKLGWGPTTLKQTLDELVEEGSVTKEARLGGRGPEAWYMVKVKGIDELEQLLRTTREGSIAKAREIEKSLNKKMRQLAWQDDDTEWKVFTKRLLREKIEIQNELNGLRYLNLAVYIAKARRDLGKDKAMKIFDYTFDNFLKDPIREDIKETWVDLPAGFSADDAFNLLAETIKDMFREKYGYSID